MCLLLGAPSSCFFFFHSSWTCAGIRSFFLPFPLILMFVSLAAGIVCSEAVSFPSSLRTLPFGFFTVCVCSRNTRDYLSADASFGVLSISPPPPWRCPIICTRHRDLLRRQISPCQVAGSFWESERVRMPKCAESQSLLLSGPGNCLAPPVATPQFPCPQWLLRGHGMHTHTHSHPILIHL